MDEVERGFDRIWKSQERGARLARPGMEGERIFDGNFQMSKEEFDDKLQCTRVKLDEWM
jgi:hypothetical protein